MEGWIRSFAQINQDHKDTSDYERFFTHARHHLELNPLIHVEMSSILVEALDTFGNKSLLSIAYRLLWCMSCSPDVPEHVLKRDFGDEQLREHLFPLISKFDWRMFDAELLKLLYDPHYECRNFLDLMRYREAWVIGLLDSRDPQLARKQMMVAIHTGMYRNLGHFLRFFGHSDRSLSFLAFEVFDTFVKQLEPGACSEGLGLEVEEDRTGVLYEDPLFDILHGSGRTWISLKTRLEIECPTNFLIHFLDFLPCSDAVRKLITENDVEGVRTILERYVVMRGPLAVPHPRWITPRDGTRMEDQTHPHIEEDVCFEYLFGGHSYKDMADCIEI